MAAGKLKLTVTNTRGEAIGGKLRLSLRRTQGDTRVRRFTLDGAATTAFTITDLEPDMAPYQAEMEADHFLAYPFLTVIGSAMTSSTIRLVTNPKAVTGITAPGSAKLRAAARRALEGATMTRLESSDDDLVGLTGEALYAKTGPLRQACFLNLVKKASDAKTAGNCWQFVESLRILRQDRCFVQVRPGIRRVLENKDLFKPVNGSLHDELEGYTRRESYKSKDRFANLQVTLMENSATGTLAADFDIDEAQGLRHWGEVLRNKILKMRTNPYLVRELLILAEPTELVLDPGYDFLFA